MTQLSAEDQKLVTLARATMARVGAPEGAAVVDTALDRSRAIGDFQHAAERARAVSAGQLAAFTGFSISVVGGKPAFGLGHGEEGNRKRRNTNR